MRTLFVALILTIPLTCYAGEWSKVIASSIVTVQDTNVSCQNGVCFVRQREKAVVVNGVKEVVKTSTKLVQKKRVYRQRKQLFRKFFLRRRCCG